MKKMTLRRRSAAIRLLEELLLINVPILIYVMIEAHHKNGELIREIILSPEWCIGTVVMSFQAFRLYIYGTADGPRKAPGIVVILLLAVNSITGAAFYLLSMHEHSSVALQVKWTLFGLATIFFALFGGAGLWSELQHDGAKYE